MVRWLRHLGRVRLHELRQGLLEGFAKIILRDPGTGDDLMVLPDKKVVSAEFY
jgi:hypothetical protein